MKKLLLHPSLKPLLMLTIVIVTVVSGFQLHSLMNYREDVSHIELTEEKLQGISKPVPNQIVLNFSPGTTKVQRDEYITSIGGTISSESDALNSAVVNLPESIAVADLPKSDFVAAPEENYFVMALENPVNDPEYSNQWSLPVIKAPELWSTGTQVEKIVAVIDSGICDQHPDLQGRVVEGYDFIEGDTSPFDDNGHGCSVSGIIAANINDGIGIAGVGKNVKIMPLKVLDSLGIGTYSNVANAIVYAVDHGADIINLSLGGTNPSSILSNAISYAETNNVIVVAAAGNTGTEGVLYPAGYPYVISVGSTNEQLQQSTFSSFGPGVDILAPGEKILTTGLDSSYRYVSGTSYSAPVVSGILTIKNVDELELNDQGILYGVPEIDEEGIVNAQANDTTGYASLSSNQKDLLGFPHNNCTSYVAWRINQDMGITDLNLPNRFYNSMPGPTGIGNQSNRWSNAENWDDQAIELGYTVVESPMRGDIAVWEKNQGGALDAGHVAYVESVNSDGSVNISEYNWGSNPLAFGTRTHVSNASKYVRLNVKHEATFTFTGRFGYLVSNQPAANIPVVMFNESGQKNTTYTNNEGNFTFNNVRFGSGTVTATFLLGQYNWSYSRHQSGVLDIGLKILVDGCTQSLNVIADQNCTPSTPGDGGSTNQGDSSDFITDVTIPDKTVVGLNSSFTKIWRLKNNGTSTWNSGYKLAFQSGYRLGATSEVSLNQSVSPGGTVDVSVNMVSPNVGGTYKGYWKLKNSGGQLFGDQVWVEIVAQNGASTPTNTGNGQVKLFANANYANQIGTYGTGDTNHPNANSFSIEITSGWSVKLYSKDNYSGEEKCLYQSKADLTDITWNLRIQSMRVYSYYACGSSADVGGKVRLYAYANYENFLGEYGPGKTDAPNNNSKSMHIPSGWSVKTYRNNTYGGGDRCWNESEDNLEDQSNWQYDIDSMEVFPTDVCPQPEPEEVKLCTQPDYGGTCIIVTSDIQNLAHTSVGDNNLKSYQVGGPWEIVIFEHPDFQGRSIVQDGSNTHTDDLPWMYGASSIRVRRVSPGNVRLFDNMNSGGDMLSTDRSLDSVDEWRWKTRAESLEIRPDFEAIVCTEYHAHGTCGRTKVNRGDLNQIAQGLRGNVGSLRICSNECPAAAAIPVLTSPLNGIRYLPGSNVTLVWNGNGGQYKYELSGGGLQTPITDNWMDGSITYKTISNLPASNNPYTWRVRGWNYYGEGNWSTLSTFFVIDTQINNVEISGPSVVEVDTNVTLSAEVNPQDASNVKYTWSPAPASGQNTNTAIYNFSSPGIQNITLTSSNSAGSVQSTKQITVNCPEGHYKVEFFNSSTLSEPSSNTCSQEINQDWGTSGPGGAGNVDFSGTGKDGNLNIASGQTVITDPQRRKLTAHAAAGATTITTDNISGLTVGDEVMIIHMKNDKAGLYDLAYITAISGNNLTLNKPLINQYHLDYNQIQVVRIPNYDNLVVDGTLTVNYWDSMTGGVLAFRARTTTIGATGLITATARGYTGGARTYGKAAHGKRGESLYNPMGATTRYADWNGGGGGPGTYDGGAGAGGGSYATPGGTATDPFYGDPGIGAPHLYGDVYNSRLYFGGAGGSGGTDDSAWDGVPFGGFGGHGGGIIIIGTNRITGSGRIESNGGAGENHNSVLSSEHGGGGGGAGGSIELVTQDISLLNIKADGGPGGKAKDGYGGNGGQGRVSIDYCNKVAVNVPGHHNKLINCTIDNFSARYTKTQNFEEGTYKFSTKADDGVKVWIDDELIIDEWTSGYKEKDVTKTIASGNHTIKVEYMELTGDAKVNFGIEEVVAPPIIFTGEYFNNKTLTGTPVLTNTTENIDYNWTASPGTGVASNLFSVRWTGSLDVATPGEYTFKGTGDDGIRLFIDDVEVFNGWKDQGPSAYLGLATLTQGTHTIRYEYYDNSGGAVAKLSWEEGNKLPFNEACTSNNNEYCVTMYNNTTLSGTPIITGREVGPLDYKWVGSSPRREVNANSFSGRWTGNFYFTAGTYKFTYYAEDGMVARIDNELAINQWVNSGVPISSFTRTMTEGLHEIKVEFKETTVDAGVKFIWEQTTEQINVSPQVTQILGQRKNLGQTFTTINLNNYGSDPNGDVLSWAYSGNSDLTVTITNKIATITAPNNWVGTNNITFTATDPGGLSASSTATFKMNAPPVVTQIPGQTVTQGQSFATINLSNYVSDPGDTITWSKYGTSNLVVTIANNIATITVPSGWTGSNDITFRATDSNQVSASSTATFTVNAVVAGCQQNQFSSKYFNNMTLTGTAIDKGCINNIAFDWAGGSPSGVNTDSFSARYEGNYAFDAGTYTFTTLSDNGVRLYVDGVLKIDQWVSHSPQTDIVDVQLTAGSHAIKLEYFENQYSAKISLSWNLKTTTTGTELLSAPWDVVDEDGGSEERYQAISSSVLAGKTTLRITYDLNGLTALPGDASAIIFDQDGWKYISLSNYGVNGLDGIQTVDIPLSAFTGLNLTTGSTMIHTRFWYETGFDVDILSIKVL